jgi:hypothetical protein
MAKKWYELFVERGDGGPTAEAVGPELLSSDVAPVVVSGPVSDAATPEAIYAAAQISAAPHGFTILKVAAMLESEHIRELPAEVRRKSILVALDAAQVPLKEIVADAVLRDRALDTYERVLEQNLEQLRASALEENRQLEAELERHAAELRARIDANNHAVAQARNQFGNWRAGKQLEESRIAAAVAFFVDENPISHTADGGQGATEDVR